MRLALVLLLFAATAHADMWEEFKNLPPTLVCPHDEEVFDTRFVERGGINGPLHRRPCSTNPFEDNGEVCEATAIAIENEVYAYHGRRGPTWRQVAGSSVAIRIPRETYYCREEGADYVCEPRELMRYRESAYTRFPTINCTKPTPENPSGCW